MYVQITMQKRNFNGKKTTKKQQITIKQSVSIIFFIHDQIQLKIALCLYGSPLVLGKNKKNNK